MSAGTPRFDKRRLRPPRATSLVRLRGSHRSAVGLRQRLIVEKGGDERPLAAREFRAPRMSGPPDDIERYVGCPGDRRLEAAHVEALVEGLADDAFARDLPGGLRAETEYGKLVVSRASETPRAVAPSLLPVPGNADLGQAGEIVAVLVDPTDIAGTPDSVTISADGLGTLVVDGVRPGDRMRPLGMMGTRKLSDLLVDEKVARRHRAAVPVVRDGERVVWLAGVRMSEEYAVGALTARAVRLTWQRP